MKATSHTRYEILKRLRVDGPSTASELTKSLGITLSAVRQQLSILESESLIDPVRRAGQRGRPQHKYHLTEEAEVYFTKTYASLALEMLEDLVQQQGKEGLRSFLKARKQRMTQRHKDALHSRPKGQSTLEVVAHTQDKSGYMATVQKEGNLTVLQEHNCPFIDVARKYPEFCEIERQVYEEVLGKPVHLEDCRARGARVCRFCIEASD